MTLRRVIGAVLFAAAVAAVLAVIGIEAVYVIAWTAAALAVGLVAGVGMAPPAAPLAAPHVEEPGGLRHDVRHLSTGFDVKTGRARDEVRRRVRGVVDHALRSRGIDPGRPGGREAAERLLGPVALTVLDGGALTLAAVDDLLSHLEDLPVPSRQESA